MFEVRVKRGLQDSHGELVLVSEAGFHARLKGAMQVTMHAGCHVQGVMRCLAEEYRTEVGVDGWI